MAAAVALLAEGAPAKKGGRGVASVLRSKTAERVQPNCRNKILQSIVANIKMSDAHFLGCRQKPVTDSFSPW